MRVLLIAAQPFYTQRGTPIAVRLLAEEIGRLKHEVDLLTYWEGEDVDIPGVEVIRAWKIPGIHNIPIGFSFKKVLANCSLLAAFMRLIVARRYDIVHAVEESVFFAMPSKWIHRASVFYDMDSSLAQQMSTRFERAKFLHGFFARMESWAIRRSDRIVAVCEDLAVLARSLKDAEDVFVLNDIVPPESTKDSPQDNLRDLIGSDELLAMYVGNLESYQGIDLLVDAAAKLPPDLRLRIVVVGGSDPDIREYRRLVESRSLGDRVLFPGPRPLSQLMHYLEQADILLSPRASGNNTPLKIYCYMSAGKPIVATEIVSHTQVLTDEMAVLVPPSGEAIAEGLVRLAADPDLRRRLGTHARSEAESRYTLTAFRETLQRVYSQLP